MKRLSLLFPAAFLIVFPIGTAALAQQLLTSEEFWQTHVKEPLTRLNGRDLFVQRYKDALLPGPYLLRGGRIRGTVISATPEDAPRRVVLAIADRATPEATLVCVPGQSLSRPLPFGTTVEFQGVAKDFTAAPFMVTFEVDGRDVRLAQ